MPDEKSPAQKVRDLYENAIKFWQPRRDAMDRLEEFLAGDRYEDDNGAYNKDHRLIQIRGQETQDTIRHIAAKATERPRSIEPRPIDRVEDPDTGEVAAALVEADLANPWKGFEDVYEAAIISCREKRLGVVMMDWVPDCGAFGEILDRYVDPRRIMWDPAYEDPHHPLCGWLLEEKRVDIEEARHAYKAPWIQPDRDAFLPSGQIKPGVPLMRGADGDRLPGARSRYDDNKVTLWFCWYKNDRTTKYGGEQKGSYQPLEEGDRYMSCGSGCGYRSETQGQLQDAGTLNGGLPDAAGMMNPIMDQPNLPFANGCPTCGGDLNRQDAKAIDQTVLAYQKGKRLTIVAPFSPAPDDKPPYDGKWPIPKARSFPGLFLTAYQKPGEPTGPCDVDLMWDQQIASDQLRTLAVQRVFEHRNYWEMPLTGVFDVNRNRFEFRDDQFNVMYRDGTNQFQSPVSLHQGAGLDPNWPVAFQATQEALTRYRPALDVGSADENTRNIPVGTIERITHEAETSTEHFNRRKNRALGKFYGVRWDYIRATYTPARLARLNIDGVDIFANLAGDDLPNFDFILSDTPPITGMEKSRTEAFQGLLQVALNPQTRAFLDVFADVNNLPRSLVRKIEKRIQEAEAEAAAAQTIPPEGGLGASSGGAPPGLEEMLSMNGGTQPPAM